MRMTKLLACVILLTALPVYAAELGCVGDCANGTGTYYFSGGGRYEGEWKDGAQTGQGTYYFANGDRYEGEFKVGYFDGRGTLYHASKVRYEGEWKYHKQHGQGTFYFANGDSYEGEWKRGKLLQATPPVFGQGSGSEWDTLMQEVVEFHRTGKYDRGVVIARKALQVAEKNDGPEHPNVVRSLNFLAMLYGKQGQYAQAEPLF